MTKVITRYFDSADQAGKVRDTLIRQHQLPDTILSVFTSAEGLADALADRDVNAKTARLYEERVAGGGAVLMVRAGYKPLGVARIAREVTAAMGAVDLPGMVEEVSVREERESVPKILKDHPKFMTRAKDPSRTNYHMAEWPIPLIIPHGKPVKPVFPPHARMANVILPLLTDRRFSLGSAIRPHARMANFPIPLISRRKPADKFAFPRHARMADFPIPLLSRRKPYTGSLIPRHQRMANWPFPLLINGKTGTNSVIPGGPHMANFPIPLISRRKPADRFAFHRHARMANFPIPLLSKREPYTGSAIPRHGRMADFPLPLVVEESKGQRFSFSGMLGLKTVIRR